MYVCVCNAVTVSAIRQAVGEGASSIRDLSFMTGCGTQCGSCVSTARNLLDDALAEDAKPHGKPALRLVSSL